jgi:hypothetical protein
MTLNGTCVAYRKASSGASPAHSRKWQPIPSKGALKGDEWRSVFRRRIGDYCILFTADRARQNGLHPPHPDSFRKIVPMRTPLN